MRFRSTVTGLLLAATACVTTTRSAPSLHPIAGEAELHVYVQPLPRDADPLTFTVESVSLRRVDGGEVPLQLETRQISGADPRAQRPLAWGRVPPGEYAGLDVKIGSAKVVRGGEPARLMVEPDPIRVELSFRLASGAASVAWLALDPSAVRSTFAFAPGFKATLAPQTPPQLAVYVTNTGSASVTVIDRRARLVTGLIPTGSEPIGIAIDRAAARAYVSLSREDQIDVLDVAANASIGRIRLMPGDGPGEIGVSSDGTLVVVNVRSRTVSFVDPGAQSEVGRAKLGDDPVALLVDRGGRRAYVANRGSGTITVLDVPNRAVVGTISTDPEPLKMALSRDGSRLYVVHRGSNNLAVFSVPTLAPLTRTYIGLGAVAVKVDPRTDLVYLSRREDPRLWVFDPVALQVLDQFAVPGEVSQMVIDDADDALLALVPGRRLLAVVDLTSRAVLAEIPVGAESYGVALAGERF